MDSLWREFSQPLRAFFRGRARDQHEAEDLLQETFLRIHAGLGSLREGERYAAWVRRVARNVWIDARRRWAPTDLGDADRDADRHADVDALALADQQAEHDLLCELACCLEHEITELGEPHSEVLRRAEIVGERHEKIARDLELSLSAVKSRVQRGRVKLRQRLEDCCAFEFDRRGGLLAYRQKRGDCDG